MSVEEKDDVEPLADYTGPWIKKRIEFHYESKHSIDLFGSWNRFKGGDELEYKGENTYSVEVNCPLGNYVYRFLIDGEEWETDNSLAKKIVDGIEYNILVVKENGNESEEEEEEHSDEEEAHDEENGDDNNNNNDDDDNEERKVEDGDKSLVYDQSTGQFVVSQGKKKRRRGGRPSMEIDLPSTFVADAQKVAQQEANEKPSDDNNNNNNDQNETETETTNGKNSVDVNKKRDRKRKKKYSKKQKPRNIYKDSDVKELLKQNTKQWANTLAVQEKKLQMQYNNEIRQMKELWIQEREVRVEIHNKTIFENEQLQKNIQRLQIQTEKLKKQNEISDSLDKKRIFTLEEEKTKQQQEIENLRKSLRASEQKVDTIRKENVEVEKTNFVQYTDIETERKKLTNEINNLKLEISSLKSQNDLLTKNYQTLEMGKNKTKQLETERVDQMQKSWEDEKNDLLKIKNDFKQLKIELSIREKELQNEKELKNNIEKEKQQEIQRANEYQERIKKLESEHEILKNSNEAESKIKIEVGKARKDLETERKQLEDKINILDKRLNEQKESYENDIKKMKEQFSADMNSVSEKSDKEASARIESLRKEISSREDEIRSCKDKIAKLETYVGEEKSNNEGLEKKLANIEQDYAKLNNEKASIEKTNDHLHNELNNIKNELKKALDQYNYNNEESSTKIKNLESEIAGLRNNYNEESSSFDRERKKYQDQIETYQNDLNSKSEEAAKISQQLTATQQELQNYKTSEANLKIQVENLSMQIQNETKDSIEKLKTYENKISQLEQNIEILRNEKNNKIHELEDVLSKTKEELSDVSNRNVNAETNLQKLNAEIDSMTAQFRKEKSDLEKQLESASSKDQKIIDSCKSLFTKFQTLRTEMDAIRNQKIVELEKMNEFFPSFGQLLNKAFGFHQDMVDNLMQKYKRELTLRRKYFNIVQDLRGNIRVFCRVRPMLKAEVEQKLQSPFNFPNDGEIEVLDEKGNKNLFTYDRVYAPNTTQAQVSEDTTEYIQSVMDGYNVSIFAYGQTGSGKTYTMEGPPENPGVNLNALKTLFQLAEERTPMFEYKIKVSVFEIYNEKIKDLISNYEKKGKADKKEQKKKDEDEHKILHLPDGSVEVTGLAWVTVKSLQDVINLNVEAKKNRSLAATAMNSDSSRSHMLLVVDVHGFNVPANIEYSGKLYLVDLAGSERVKKSAAEGQTLKEAQNINKSLAALGDVMQALQQKAKFVPYRNSTLTDLMANALGGNAKTVMFVNCRPTNNDTFETISSLKFAERVGKVEMGQAKKNVGPTVKKAAPASDAKAAK